MFCLYPKSSNSSCDTFSATQDKRDDLSQECWHKFNFSDAPIIAFLASSNFPFSFFFFFLKTWCANTNLMFCFFLLHKLSLSVFIYFRKHYFRRDDAYAKSIISCPQHFQSAQSQQIPLSAVIQGCSEDVTHSMDAFQHHRTSLTILEAHLLCAYLWQKKREKGFLSTLTSKLKHLLPSTI